MAGVYHSKSSHAQPNYHKNTCDTDQGVNHSGEPADAEAYPIYKVKAEYSYYQPVDCADYYQYQRNNAEHVECCLHYF